MYSITSTFCFFFFLLQKLIIVAQKPSMQFVINRYNIDTFLQSIELIRKIDVHHQLSCNCFLEFNFELVLTQRSHRLYSLRKAFCFYFFPFCKFREHRTVTKHFPCHFITTLFSFSCLHHVSSVNQVVCRKFWNNRVANAVSKNVFDCCIELLLLI